MSEPKPVSFLAAQGDPAEAFEFVEETFDKVPLFIDHPINCSVLVAGRVSYYVCRCFEINGHEIAQIKHFAFDRKQETLPRPLVERMSCCVNESNTTRHATTSDMVPVVKLARAKNVPYSRAIGCCKGLDFGRIADAMKGRRFPDIPPAIALPPDFPVEKQG